MTSPLTTRLFGKIGRLVRCFEAGSMDGGTFGDIAFMPFLISLVLLGLMLALIGFWRISASYTAQRSVQVGAVAPTSGNDALSQTWSEWTNSDGPTSGFAVDPKSRSVQASVITAKTFSSQELGSWEFGIQAQAHARSERFYGGQPVCDGAHCEE